MRCWRLILALALAGLSVLIGPDEDQEKNREARVIAAKSPEPRCPVPEVAALRIRAVSEDGRRIAVSGRAHVGRGHIGSFEVWWGDRQAVHADMFGRRKIPVTGEHRYPRPGTYRISVIAESSARGCRGYKQSPPATLRVPVPVTPTSYPSSP